jgi:hypothetical protein
MGSIDAAKHSTTKRGLSVHLPFSINRQTREEGDTARHSMHSTAWCFHAWHGTAAAGDDESICATQCRGGWLWRDASVTEASLHDPPYICNTLCGQVFRTHNHGHGSCQGPVLTNTSATLDLMSLEEGETSRPVTF